MHHYEEYLRKSKRPLLSEISKKKDDEKKPSILSSFDNDFNYGDDDLIFYLEMDTINTNREILVN
jgi:hypothetical protein